MTPSGAITASPSNTVFAILTSYPSWDSTVAPEEMMWDPMHLVKLPSRGSVLSMPRPTPSSELDSILVLKMYASKIDILHLHGVLDGKDHLPLENLSPEVQSQIGRFLSSFQGTLSIEMFSFDFISRSLPLVPDLMYPESNSTGRNHVQK